MNVRSRGWCFTLNNPADDIALYDPLLKKGGVYLIIGDEFGKSGTHHHQGYLYFENPRSFQSIKELLPDGCHIEKARGTPKQASDYCRKDKILLEIGECPIQGKRNDIAIVKDMIKNNSSMREIIEGVDSYQAIRCAELILRYAERQRIVPPQVMWFWGSTGKGKTRYAMEMCPNAWISGRDLKWWCGYDAHKEIIIDDFRADFCTFHELLRILDRYPYRVQIKGGSRELLAETIIITSAVSPYEAYTNCSERIDQLLRRINTIRNFDDEPYIPTDT